MPLENFDLGIRRAILSQFGAEIFDNDNNIVIIEDKAIKFPDIRKVIVGRIAAENIKESQYLINSFYTLEQQGKQLKYRTLNNIIYLIMKQIKILQFTTNVGYKKV